MSRHDESIHCKKEKLSKISQNNVHGTKDECYKYRNKLDYPDLRNF